MKKIFSAILLALLFLCGCGKPQDTRASLEISGPAGMISEVAGKKFNANPLKLKLPGGNYLFRFEAPGFVEQYKAIKLAPSQSVQSRIVLERVKCAVLLTSKPLGAKVKFRGREVGMTPMVLTGLTPGNYSAELSMQGHAGCSVEWEVENERPIRVMGDLVSNLGRMKIETQPRGARVFIGGEEVGVTPFSAEREEGRYTIRLEKAGFNPEERTLDVVKNRSVPLRVTLSQRPGGVEVASVPEGAELFINDVKRGVTPCRIEGLNPGKYMIKLTKAGFDPLEEKVTVAPGAVDRKKFELLCSTGSVIFSVMPAGVEVNLDGVSLGRSVAVSEGSRNTREFVCGNLQPGKHRITVFHQYGRPPKTTVSFKVEKNKRTQLPPIEVWIANCEIIYNDGTRKTGALYQEEERYVLFGPEPGIKIRLERSDIRQILPLQSR